MYGSLLQIKDRKKELFTHLFLFPGGSLTCKIGISDYLVGKELNDEIEGQLVLLVVE